MPHYKIEFKDSKLKAVKKALNDFEIDLDHNYFSHELIESKVENHFGVKVYCKTQDDLERLLAILP